MTDSIAQYQTGGDLFGVMEQADSPVRVIVPTVTKEHQASIGTGTATAGTATLTGRPVGMDAFETIFLQRLSYCIQRRNRSCASYLYRNACAVCRI